MNANNGHEIPILRAIRGPVTLITLGVLFALQNFTGYSFDQTWPVLLIVFGLLTLVGRSAEPRGPVEPVPGPPPMGNYPPPSYPPPGSYRQSQYPQAAPPAGAPASSAPPRTGEPRPNVPSGPTGGSV